MYKHDQRVVLTLDAGGTNFVFSAIQACEEVVAPICLPAASDDLDKCLSTLIKGFSLIKEQLKDEPVAISFAFPGPADYENGIIGDLPNFPSFRGGVALGPFLEAKFGIPVYINNDGNLFAYGEALAGTLPALNAELEAAGNPKRYRNLLGITLGTGFGAGVVINNCLLTGDNGCGGDVWIMRNKKYPEMIAEESVSIRAVRRVYSELSGEDATALTPKDIFDIAEGNRPGNSDAAIRSFEEMGEMAGAAIAAALHIVDGLVVIGGGLAGASKYIVPGIMKELNRPITTFAGRDFACLQMEVCNLLEAEGRQKFFENTTTLVQVPSTSKHVQYNSHKRIGITVSALGASKAVALGAYSFALQQLG
ncbi:ROK family protein [uncultured Bacteroides sp.]|uniref:ROK family protein n=1 Tax=uncultured Bacteroides sp. TaxID=162156 RepID=UPI0025D464B5|nr:ROK family protein [uncultured Bacteroides sp.]